MTKRIVLCADDYGQELAISQGILDLLGQGRLSAASCLVTEPCWHEHAAWLRPFQGRADIGLHFNLTEGEALSPAYRAAHGSHFFSLGTLLRMAFLRQLDRQAVVAECHAQLDRFIEGVGGLPDFIDGHQHVHQFPIIRDAFVQVYEERLRAHRSYVRLVDHRVGMKELKKLIIRLTGTASLKQLLNKHHIPHNPSFSGVYTFAKAANYPLYFQQFIREVGDGGLIMCHPGHAPAAAGHDVIAGARYQEYLYFSSAQFLQDCAQYAIEIGAGRYY